MSMEQRKTITAILDEFFAPALRPVNAIAEQIATKNAAILAHTRLATSRIDPTRFTCWNATFPLSHTAARYLGRPLSLAPTLIPEFEPTYQEFLRIEAMWADLYQLLTQTTCGAADSQEFRDAIPDCVAMVTTLRHTPRRVQDPLYLCKNNKYAVDAYERLLPKAEEYAAYHFIL